MKNKVSTASTRLIKVIDSQKLLILKELYLCSEHSHLCGSDLCDKFDIQKNLLSYHIKALRHSRLLNEKKVGRKKYYFVPDTRKTQVKKLLEAFEII